MTVASVIVPCFNREDLLGETLDSLKAQTFGDWEALIVDDHSQDNSVGIAQSYAAEDSRFRVLRRASIRKGANVCRNQGVAAANGRYIIFLDSDDLLSPTCIEGRVAAMECAPSCDYGVFQTELFTDRIGDRKMLWNIYTEEKDLKRFLSMDSVWLTSGPIWRKEALERIGGYGEDVLCLQDWDIHMRALIENLSYFKQPIRDNYHRHEYGSKTTISAVSMRRPDHIRSQERLFDNILDRLRKAELLDADARPRVAGLFWWAARRWQAIGEYHNARRVWRRACDLGFISRRQYLEGSLIFYCYAVRGAGRLARLIQRGWPHSFYHFHSEHLWASPLPADADEQERLALHESLNHLSGSSLAASPVKPQST